PQQSWDQVAALLNVRPAADPGQPVRLALAPAQAPTPASQPVQQAFASDDPAPVAQPVVVAARAAATQPVTIAAPAAPARPAAKDVPAWMSAAFAAEDLGVTAANAAPEPQEETRPVYAEAVQALVTPQSAVVRASAPVPRTSERRYLRAAAKPATFAARPAVATGPGAFAVQLGAFSSPTGVERAWAQAYQRFGFGAQTPLSTTVKAGARTLHRLSVAGFQTYADATRVCQAVRAKGGACFVRAVAGDAPVQWASRYTSGRRG
ncbi:MAG TPA: SPOR domain-containing protein, partial [Allosphingosinicella sp.]